MNLGGWATLRETFYVCFDKMKHLSNSYSYKMIIRYKETIYPGSSTSLFLLSLGYSNWVQLKK